MRVISGKAGGRRLETLEVDCLRPMLDRVKEALFNIIRFEVEEARTLDLFAGSGALGIEALSRGARSALFVESDPRLAELIERNVRECGLEQNSQIRRASVFSLPAMHPPSDIVPAGLVFVDPPYAMIEDPNRRAELFAVLEDMAGVWILGGATLIVHHSPMPHILWPTDSYECSERRVYGRSQLSFFRAGSGKEQ